MRKPSTFEIAAINFGIKFMGRKVFVEWSHLFQLFLLTAGTEYLSYYGVSLNLNI